MKANELRIGNKFKQPGDEKVYEVVALQEDRVAYAKEDMLIEVDYWWFDADHILPIPLTPEILQKAGFQYMKSLDGQHYWNNKFGITQINFHEWYTEWELLNNPCPQNKIQYLHQLQNLYFALTGEELMIEEETPA